MGDREILKLLAERDENAILELQRKYGRYCHTVAFNVLGSPEDAEECVNDAFLQLWNAYAPDRVTDLKRYVAAVVRNVAINRFKAQRRRKRQPEGGTANMVEAENDAAPEPDPDERLTVSALLNEYLHKLLAEKRLIFVARYYYDAEISEISEKLGIPEGTVNSTLSRIRKGLRKYLAEEGIDV